MQHAFAGFIDKAANAVRFGIVKGTNSSMTRYAHSLAIDPAEAFNNSVSVSLEPDDYVTVLRNLGATIRALVVSETGAVVLDKEYASPNFTASTGLSFQQTRLDRISGLNRYLLSVFVQRQFFSPPATFGYSNSIIAMQLESDGAIRWATNLTLVTSTLGTIAQGIDSSGNVAYVVNDSEINLSTLTQTNLSHVIKLTASGNLAWVKTVNGTTLNVPSFTGQAVWLAGTRPVSTTGFDVDAVLVKLDSSNGSLLAQATLDKGGSEMAGIAGFNQNRIFFGLTSFDATNSFLNQTGHVASADLSLQNFSFSEYARSDIFFGTLVHDPAKACLLYSPKSSASTDVTVIALDENLAPAQDCGLFVTGNVSVQNTGLSITDRAVALSNPGVTVSNPGTSLGTTTLDLTALSFNTVDVCEATGDCPQPTLSLRWEGAELLLEFQSSSTCTYNIQRTTDLGQSFQTVQTQAGTGGALSINLGAPIDNAFYLVQVVASP